MKRKDIGDRPSLAVRCRQLKRARLILSGLLLAALVSATAGAATVKPITDAELYRRANLIVHGVVTNSEVVADADSRPVTVSTILPIEILKGTLSGELSLHQLGGTLPDGQSLQFSGRPEYVPGQEVVVFAIARPEGGYQTAELLLGKFTVTQDAQKTYFAEPELKNSSAAVGVDVLPADLDKQDLDKYGGEHSLSAARELGGFLRFLREGARQPRLSGTAPVGEQTAVMHEEYAQIGPQWANLGALWRANNNVTIGYSNVGTAMIDGGGGNLAAAAASTWNNQPNSNINLSVGAGGANRINLNASSSPCGWNTCGNSGVIGCGGPNGGGTHIWRNETYNTITGGEVWVRCLSSFNGLSQTVFQSIVTHELGHAIGLGHSDQAASSHDVCRGDESAATMRSTVQSRTSLGTDDADAVRWIYGDAGTSCGL